MAGSRVERLGQQAADLAAVGDAPSAHTVASYERRWRQWQAFADHHGLVALPADPVHVAAFTVARSKAGVSPSGVSANLSAVAWFHARADRAQPDVTEAARSVARVLAKSGPARPLSPAPVLSVGALEAMVRLPMQQSRVRAARVVRVISGLRPRRLLGLRIEDVTFGPQGRWVELALPAVPAAANWPALPATTVRLEAGRTIVDCPVEAMRALVADASGGHPFDEKLVYGNARFQVDPFDPANAIPARIAARNRALVGVGYGGALRVEELSVARVEDLEPVGNGYRLRFGVTKTSRDGRTEAVRIEPAEGVLDPVRLLDGWLAVRGDSDGPLFHNLHHHTDLERGLTTGEMRSILRDQAVAVGLPKTVSGYSLRRSWATHTYLRDPASIGQVSLQLRHTRIDTTMRYIEDLGSHLLDAEQVLSSDVVLAGPGGVSAPAKNLGFASDPLDSLVAEAIAALRVPAGLAPATVGQIAHYWSGWERWCAEQGFPAFPAEPSHVLLFAAKRAEDGIAANTLRAQLKAIQRVHDDNGVPTVGFTRVAFEIVAGLERGGVAARRQAPVIPVGDLLGMAEAARREGAGDLKALRDLVMVCVGYAGGLRADDLCRARLEWLERVPSGYVLRLAASKLNQDGRRPEGVLLPARADVLDPVAAIDAWQERTGLVEGPLLPSLPLGARNRPMAREGVGDRLARLAARTGSSVRPTGHSLRRSWATHAYEAGLDLLSISRQLRHRRVTGTRTYVESLTPWPDNPSALLADGDEGDDE